MAFTIWLRHKAHSASKERGGDEPQSHQDGTHGWWMLVAGLGLRGGEHWSLLTSWSWGLPLGKPELLRRARERCGEECSELSSPKTKLGKRI